MRKNKWVVLAAILLMVLAACSQAPVEPTGSGPGRASLPADDAGADVVADTETAIEASEINGQVEAINGNIWTVDGRTVVIEEQTVGETAVAVGDTVSIQAVTRNGGVFTASRVHLAQAGNENDDNSNDNGNTNGNENDNSNLNDDNANDNGQSGLDEIEFQGIVEVMGADSWTIGGQTVVITTTTEIKGVIVEDDLVKVEAFTADDGALTAREIAPVVNEVRFTGQVEEITDTAWTISGQVVAIVAQTDIRDEIVAGDIVDVRAVMAEDGSLTALRLELANDDDLGNDNDVNTNGNENSNTNGDDNGNANSDDNGNANSDDNSNANSDDNGNANSDDNSNMNDDDANDNDSSGPGNGNNNDDDGDDNDNGGNDNDNEHDND